MLLAADVGNTNVVFALIEGREIKSRWRIATDPRRTGDEYAVWLLQLAEFQGFDKSDITQVIIGSVVPRAIHNLTVLSEKYLGITPLIAGQDGAQWGFELDIEQPSSLGADRALNTLAAHAKYDGDLILVDFGTATTFDVIDFNGAYKGGIIAPGINLSLDALVGNTAKLPRIAIEKPANDSVIGRNTESQMLIGVFWGYVALIEGLIARMKKEIGRPARVVATGGLAILFDEHTDLFDAVDADLTLEGLAILAERAA
ncbi:type III pantothenate kinase [Qipengyuania citrea]|jgi:type III pantothenate kinase|uniref:Type III pantothenate kinase n=2 Tax=Qipengyuania TaxID=1855416 RepID=A0ABY4U948_9SPHN|nr:MULTISPECIES: type III pantothenate kinase [Erythrobacteraceae]MAB45960.1 pantothenate kinase [Sphingomonadaceae bacterium]MBL4895543.1 type III pantothenate kinase [Erythrobacter sp.]MEC7952051.1 type III pantothenate kinase [Pseudomonadota bacterium]QPL38643.1 type III pantothenate kinase [Erythrobacter sp. A30-3]MBX7489140.1 type III pantothenate kinase [Qipengyuania aerophila]|tara:strand:- start:495 stop:1268 length:774 start_codon:yes stop_codon:yes gene_type:complete